MILGGLLRIWLAPQTIPQDIIYSANPSIESGISSVDHAMNAALDRTPALMGQANSSNPIQKVKSLPTPLLSAALSLTMNSIRLR